MAKFHINFRKGEIIEKDDAGIDLPSLAKACEAALLSLREVLADNLHADSKTPVEAAMITDETGRLLMTIPAKDVLPEPWKK